MNVHYFALIGSFATIVNQLKIFLLAIRSGCRKANRPGVAWSPEFELNPFEKGHQR